MRFNPSAVFHSITSFVQAVGAAATAASEAAARAPGTPAGQGDARPAAPPAPAPRRQHPSEQEMKLRKRVNDAKCDLAKHQMHRAEKTVHHVGKLG